eukprot:TRINITY_DN8598_c0_g1_i1.p1 TRINITY_DN8598_c0_g1~~TRINITY_DN8598_c0_g1_i1.p1  ORF type:complete len:330 (+),score=66.00 TRINITY_DN8598_c0_g1_i1:22-990(+)
MKLTTTLLSLFCIALFCSHVLSARFVVSHYGSNDNTCSGDPEWKAEVEDDGSCVKASDGVYLKVQAGENNGYVVSTYPSSACAVTTFSVDMEQLDLDSCKAITYLNVNFGHLRVSRAFFCFPGDSKVTLESGKVINMEDLRVGDMVQTQHGFSEVYAFLDKRPQQLEKFQKIYYMDNSEELKHIRLTREHLILAKSNLQDDAQYVLAEGIKVGHYIHIKSEDNEIIEAQVIKVELVEDKGTFTPATMDGTIIVDNVVASIGAVVSHEITQSVLYPLRLAYSMNPSFVPDQEEGIHPYALKFREVFSSWLNTDSAFYSAPKLE